MLRLFALAAVWLLWSGHYSIEHGLVAVFGVASCLVVYALYMRMRAHAPHGLDRTLGARTLLYIPWLLKEIVTSNLTVARIVLDPKLPISPCIVKVKATQRGEGARVLFANSITLTPGTISLEVRDDTIWVHALTKEFAKDLQGGEMDRRVSALEDKP
ncbi:MAG: Na+/H+ antiporter subunit E [Myxococcales bacterium]|nr:Na+/H+ antiporter subunit E [Myxococcales bacterium]